MSRIVEIDSSNFDAVLKSARKVFVDFWAPWCKPCVRMNPLIEKMADKHGSITFARVNVEKQSEIATRYHISSLPAYLFFSDSRPSQSKIGAVSELELERFVSQAQ
ncbi:MAG: thioredoxin family protein [Nitrososphaerales archaeon]